MNSKLFHARMPYFMRRQYCLPDFVIRSRDYYAHVVNYFSALSLVNCLLHSNLFLIHALFMKLLTSFLFIEIWFTWWCSHPLLKWSNIPPGCSQALPINCGCSIASLRCIFCRAFTKICFLQIVHHRFITFSLKYIDSRVLVEG